MTQARRQAERRRRLLTGAFSAAVHAAAIAALFLVHADQTEPADIEPIPVTLVPPLKPPEPPAPPTEVPKPPTAAAKPPPAMHVRPAKPPPPTETAPVLVAKGPSGDAIAELSDAEVAGAGTAESGGGAGCNMTRWLQTRLRGDPMVRSALADAHAAHPLLVWNGDWIRHGEQEGAGLAAVREAIMWEVGFAPVACRSEAVHGLILISLEDRPGGPRVALGRADWRWTDLLSARRR